MNRLKIAAATLAAVAATGVGLAAPAAADSQAHRDPKGDVTKLDVPQRAAKAKPGIDIVRLKNTYQGTKLTMSLTMANLEAKGYGAEWIVTTEDNTYILIFDHTGKKPRVQFQSLGGARVPKHAVGLGRAARGTACGGAKAVDKGNTVVGSIPRSCLGGADQVRVAGLTIEPSQSNAKIDDSRQKGFDSMSGPKFGPVLDRN